MARSMPSLHLQLSHLSAAAQTEYHFTRRRRNLLRRLPSQGLV